jgi:hypothetical protein
MDRVRPLQGDLLVRYALAFLTFSVLKVTAIASNRKAKSCFIEVTAGNKTSIDQASPKIMREAVYLGIGVGYFPEEPKPLLPWPLFPVH